MLINTLYKDNEEISIESYLEKCGVKDVQEYLNPSGKYIESPFIYKNMVEAVQLMKYHILQKSQMYIIQDGDSDGITSTVILYKYLKLLEPNLSIKILLHSGKQRGLGDEELFNQIMENPRPLLIIPDAGTNELEQTRKVFDNGTDVLVIDHHDIITPIDCGVLVNNQLQDCNKDLSGCGVTHKFLQALDKEFNVNYSGRFIDLVALSIVSDSMDIRSLENRCYLKFGLSNIKNELFKCFVDEYVTKDLSLRDVAFSIVPKINSVIRSDSQEDKQNMVLGFLDIKDTHEISKMCGEYHKNQTELVKKLVDKYSDMLYNDNKVNIIYDKEIPRSYSGLLAGKLAELGNKPCIVGKCKDGEIIGSFRGSGITREQIERLDGVNWANGHSTNAFGVSLDESKILSLQEQLNSLDVAYKANIEVLMSYSSNNIPNSIWGEFEPYNELWGNGITKPQFYVFDIKFNSNDIQIIGKKKNTIKVQCKNFSFLYFNSNEQVRNDFHVGEKVNLKMNCLCSLEKNVWNGKVSYSILIDKYEIEENNNMVTFDDLF